MADFEAIFQKVKEIVARKLVLDEDDIHPHSLFEQDLGADSLARIELLMEFEEAFGIGNIPDEDAEHLPTVQAVVDYIADYQDEHLSTAPS